MNLDQLLAERKPRLDEERAAVKQREKEAREAANNKTIEELKSSMPQLFEIEGLKILGEIEEYSPASPQRYCLCLSLSSERGDFLFSVFPATIRVVRSICPLCNQIQCKDRYENNIDELLTEILDGLVKPTEKEVCRSCQIKSQKKSEKKIDWNEATIQKIREIIYFIVPELENIGQQ